MFCIESFNFFFSILDLSISQSLIIERKFAEKLSPLLNVHEKLI